MPGRMTAPPMAARDLMRFGFTATISGPLSERFGLGDIMGKIGFPRLTFVLPVGHLG